MTPEVHPGSEEGLSDGSHKQSCASVPPSATWARDTGRVCGTSQPTQHWAASETPGLVHLMALCAVLVWGWGHTTVAPCLGFQPTPPVWRCKDPAVQLAQAASMTCRDHKAPAWPKGHAQGMFSWESAAQQRSKLCVTQPVPGESRTTLVPASAFTVRGSMG